MLVCIKIPFIRVILCQIPRFVNGIYDTRNRAFISLHLPSILSALQMAPLLGDSQPMSNNSISVVPINPSNSALPATAISSLVYLDVLGMSALGKDCHNFFQFVDEMETI